MVDTLDACPWCGIVLDFTKFDWDETKLEGRIFGCHYCGCHFKVEKKVMKPGKDKLLVNKKAAVSHLIRAMTS